MNNETSSEVTDEQVAAKWLEIAPSIDRMSERIGQANDFPVHPGSALCGDDKASDPYCVSHAAIMCLVAGVDHLHAAKSLVLDLHVLHASAVYSLIRGSLENFAVAFWMLHPTKRNDRVENCLRWNARNFRDQHTALEARGLSDEAARDAKLAKLDAIALSREIPTVNVRAGYHSSRILRYADENSDRCSPLFPWQICSGFAHGRPWAVLGLLDQEQHETTEPGTVNLSLTSDLSRVLYPTLQAFRLMVDVVELLRDRSQPPAARRR